MTQEPTYSSKINTAFRAAQRRLLLLDYDGTIRDLERLPELSVPSAALLKELDSLAKDPKTTVVVVSGRSQETLEAWLGELPVGLAAEHGFFTRTAGSGWQSNAPDDTAWKTAVRSVLEAAALAAPGSFVEEKARSLVWHYRLADPALADPLAAELPARIAALQLANIDPLPGSKVFEVRQAGIDKGTAARQWLRTGDFDFVLGAGDDLTDEAIFLTLGPAAFTIKVGPGETAARLRVDSPAELLDLLASFLD